MSKRKIIEIYYDEENEEIELGTPLDIKEFTENEKLICSQVITAIKSLVKEDKPNE